MTTPKPTRPGKGPLIGRVVTTSDPDYEEARKGWNDCYQSHPREIVFCRDTDQVVAALAYAREQSVPFRIRSGGHSLDGVSSVDGGTVIDLRELDSIKVSADATRVTVGAGARLGAIYAALAEHGRTIPGGLAPYVGIAGLALGGGWGLLSRTYSVLAHSVESLEIVTADGRVRAVDAGSHPELYWACRGGGGGSFGIVTSFTVRTVAHPVVESMRLVWPTEHRGRVFDAYQHWLPDVDSRFNPLLAIPGQSSGLDGFVALTGLFVGPHNEMTELLAPLLDQLPAPADARYGQMPYLTAIAQANKLVDPQVFTRIRFTALEPFCERPIDQQGIVALERWHDQAPPHTLTFVGGSTSAAVDRIAATDPISYPHLHAGITLNIRADWTDPALDATYARWLGGLARDLRPYSDLVYLNWNDLHIDSRTEPRYGLNLTRLTQIKNRYDPDNVFTVPGGVPAQPAHTRTG